MTELDSATQEARLRRSEPTFWLNRARQSRCTDSNWWRGHAGAVHEAAGRFARFAPLIAHCFPETAAAGGIIRSDLIRVDRLAASLGLDPHAGRLLVKADHHLPIAGSIKARGGVHAVLGIAEGIAEARGLLSKDGYAALAAPDARAVFATHRISVGSTGNLGLSVGTMASSLGFSATVHMSIDAKSWKKRSEERRVGKECMEGCRSRWSPYH